MSLARWMQKAWYQGHPLMRSLAPLASLYQWVVVRRRQRFLSGQSPCYRAPVPVLVVGNITLGGTGKTPLILWLIEHLRARGLRVGVVSRGYGAKPPSLPWLVQAGQAAQVCGDEPLLIVERTGVPLMIDPQRPRAVAALLAQEPLDIVLSDDGLQHYALGRDLELVLMDERGLGNGRCLPAGPLREPAERLQKVDAVLCNGATEDTLEGFALQLVAQDLVQLTTGQRFALEHFPAGQTLHAVAGIGNPARFFATIRQLRWHPIEHPFPDHARYRPQDFNFQSAHPVLMTEKDAVKCQSFAQPDWYYIRVQAQPSPAFVQWLNQRLDTLIVQSSTPS
ncbi:lipid-A-disaccharide kinase [Azomonas agilis]|uniref:Tetraacyldisaccharide 4'-kinase n=1 Tax=Azomonas agilis TaxID=116849 RepID=A0A562IZZ5_9GAMM|nr:tetraacyldisaccharide 4'-kinase [Azomonas agilis]TWH76496.1 lipid-A-disaccharide kinase [Azomonas agilis]